MGWKGSRDTPSVRQPRPKRALRGRRAQNARPTFCGKWEKREREQRAPSSTNDHRNRTSAVSPSEHEEKSPAFTQKLAACRAERTGSLNHCIADVVARKRQREGTNCGVSRCTLHEEKLSGAHGLHHILGVKTSMHLGRWLCSLT